MATMTDIDGRAHPTGVFGEGAPDQPDGDAAPTYRADSEQHFSRWAPGGAEGAADEGTAEHAPLIDRPRPAGQVGDEPQDG
jgi:hypothetical protein